jgi:hypothetical protein
MQVTECRTYFELIAALMARREQLNISLDTLNALAGLADRHCSKILTPHPSRFLGPVSLDNLLAALGLKITISVDDEASSRVQDQWTPRQWSAVRRTMRRNRSEKLRGEPAAATSIASAAAATSELRLTDTKPRLGSRRVYCATSPASFVYGSRVAPPARWLRRYAKADSM